MISFDQWFKDTAKDIGLGDNKNTTLPEISSPLELDGVEDPNAEGGWLYPCRACGENSPIICDPEDFDPSYHYCGDSPRCCP